MRGNNFIDYFIDTTYLSIKRTAIVVTAVRNEWNVSGMVFINEKHNVLIFKITLLKFILLTIILIPRTT